MVLINQKVADEIGTLVARHRYSVEDARDAVKSAEAASAKRNEELKEAAAERKAELVAKTEKDRQQQEEKPRNEWTPPGNQGANEISFGSEDEYEEYVNSPPRVAAPPPPPPPVVEPSLPVQQTTRRRPSFDDEDDDYENQSWLR